MNPNDSSNQGSPSRIDLPASQNDPIWRSSFLWQLHERAGVFHWSADWVTQELGCSPALAAGLDHRSDSLTVKDLWQAIPAADRDSVKAAWKRCRDEGFAEVTHPIMMDDGPLRTVQHVMEFCGGNEHLPDHVLGLMLDVTERDQLHQRLANAHNEVVSILESVGEGVYAIDDNGQITQVNSAAVAALGYDHARELLGRNAHEALHHSQQDGAPCDLSECRLHNTHFPCHTRLETVLWRKDGTSFWASCFSTPIRCSEGDISGAVITFRDLTTERQQQAQLAQAQKLESIGQLAAGVAHEINTPMQYIGDNVRYVAKSFEKMESLLQLLPAIVDEQVTDEQLAEMRREVTNLIKPRKVKSSLKQIPEALVDSIDGVKTVSSIVAAMKEFSHPGGDEMRRICLQNVLNSTITVAKNEWKYVAEVVTDFGDDLPKIPAYPSELNQAFLNVVVNAAHAIGDRVKKGDFEKGEIRISTDRDDDHVIVRIADNGGGIPKPIQDRVMEPFFTTKEVGKGTGQGLAIAHNVITNKHNGEFSFQVQPEHGTTFEFYLPINAQNAEEPVASDAGLGAELR